MRDQGKQKKKPKAVMVRKRVPSSTLYFQHDSCESCGIYSFNQPSDCGLDPTVPTAGRLEELGVCSGFQHQLLVPAERSVSTGCFFSSLGAVLSPECSGGSGQAAVCQHGHHRRESGEKEGLGLSGVAWPMFSPSGIPTGYSRGWQ